MKIKTKLTLGVGILFLLILLMSAVSTIYINALAKDTKNILVANYNTLDYSRKMLIALDEQKNDSTAFDNFALNLEKQKKNITENGEYEITDNLEKNFIKLQQNIGNTLIAYDIRKNISELMQLNMNAIERKSNIAQKTANNAIIWIVFTATLCFLIAFSLLINFPNSIANPIKELTFGIKEIAIKNYTQRIDFESHDEFGEVAIAFNTMASKLKEYESSSVSQLLSEKKRIETLINKMHDPIIGLDEQKKILFANEEALDILALKSEDIIGKNVVDISLKNDLIRTLTNQLIEHQNNRKIDANLLKIYSHHKESYFEKEIIDINSIPTGEKKPKFIGHVIILRNITSFKELDTLKTNFIGTISHELKTPIASILMSLNLLQNDKIGNTNEEQKQLVQTIKEDTERLLRISSELLNMTQVETGKIQLNIKPCRAKQIIDLAVDANKMQAEQRSISIQIKPTNIVSLVSADEEKTAWVLTNFISNAIRYSHQSSEIIIDVLEVENRIKFSVQDFGKGIDVKYKDKIFDRYFRIPGNDKEGTGLGLAISKEFIEAQNGKIEVESQIGVGSKFSFSLEKSIS